MNTDDWYKIRIKAKMKVAHYMGVTLHDPGMLGGPRELYNFLASVGGVPDYDDLLGSAPNAIPKPEIVDIFRALSGPHGYSIYKAIRAKRGI